MHDVLCGGCGKSIAVSHVKAPLRNKIYHPNCVDRKPERPNSHRDAQIYKAVKGGQSVISVSKMYSLSRQRVHAIVKERSSM